MVTREQVREIYKEKMKAIKQKQEVKDKKVTDLEKRVKALEDKAG